jgi:hypothetical protein
MLLTIIFDPESREECDLLIRSDLLNCEHQRLSDFLDTVQCQVFQRFVTVQQRQDAGPRDMHIIEARTQLNRDLSGVADAPPNEGMHLQE